MEAIRRYLFNWFFFLLFLMMTIVVFSGMLTVFEEKKVLSESSIVEDFFIKKGLYLGNQYYVRLIDGTEHRVFNSTYSNLKKGEVFQPLFGSFTIKDLVLGMSITVLMISVFLLMTWIFAEEIFRNYRWFKKIMNWKYKTIQFSKKLAEKKNDLLKRMAIIAIVLLLSVSLAFVLKNTIHKLMPIGKTNTIAYVIDHNSERFTAGRYGPTFVYTITYKYVDQNENKYEVEKRVSKVTYDLYKDQQFINISYRDNAPYDTFIHHQKLSESIAPIFSIEMLIIITVSYFVYFLVKKYMKKWGIPLLGSQSIHIKTQ